jgi:hypothetical protein
MFKDAQLGVQHSIPLSTNFKLFKYFSASINYEEVWYAKTIERSYADQSAVVINCKLVLTPLERIPFHQALVPLFMVL